MTLYALYDDITLDTMKSWAIEYSGYTEKEIIKALIIPSVKMTQQDKENINRLANILLKLYAVYDPVRSTIVTSLPMIKQKTPSRKELPFGM